MFKQLSKLLLWGLLCFVILAPHSVLAQGPSGLPIEIKAPSTTEDAKKFIREQSEKLGKAFSTGVNTQVCLNILNGQSPGSDVSVNPNFLSWANIFNTGYWIPVVPDECVRCSPNNDKVLCPYGESVPLPLNYAPQILIRLYGLLASVSIYGLILVFTVVAIRFMIGGLSKGGQYKDTAANLRTVFSALIITLTIATLFLQILYSVLQLRTDVQLLKTACIPAEGNTIVARDSQDASKGYCINRK